MYWIYDGSFEGFLCVVAESYLRKSLPDQIDTEAPQPGLFDDPQWIDTSEVQARKLLKALRKKCSRETVQRIFHAFLCDDAPRERELLIYIRMGFKEPDLLREAAHPVVFAVEAYQKRVLRTLHQLNGFARFEQLDDGTLYARIDPPRNVLPLMGPHFRKRFRYERFIIHDLKRALALVYDTRTLHLHNVHDYDIPERSADEQKFQTLWKRFFDTVAVEARINPKLQRQWVPLQYRTFMTEFMTENE